MRLSSQTPDIAVVTSSCSVLAASEPLAGTAPYARGWIILERPEPWGRDALLDSGLPPAVVEFLTDALRTHGVRFLAARRIGEQRRQGVAAGPRSVWLAFCDPDRARTHHTTVEDPEQILEWDLAALARGELPSVGEPIDRSIEFVCTHSRRDACCAVLGRDLVASIPSDQRSHVWESSHLGGHRFAATSLFLPSGRLYGRLTPHARTTRSHGSTAVEPSPDFLRGPCYLPEALQAAECRVRLQANLDSSVRLQVVYLDDGHGILERSHDEWARARVTAADGRWWIVECRASRFASPASCGAQETTRTSWQADIVRTANVDG